MKEKMVKKESASLFVFEIISKCANTLQLNRDNSNTDDLNAKIILNVKKFKEFLIGNVLVL